ncbi:MAG TPA: segregation/condensation protein A [Candidatus Nanoarchaeia archaeon]|nr:segregation/condensation protein A [Candidatus Nanoarchaeia archaeon]
MPQKQHHETILDLLTEKDEVTWQSMIYDLVRTEQMDPWDIDVSKLTKVYIETLKKLQQINFRITGKVVLAAALLLKIKSSRLVGRDIEELDRLFSQAEQEEEDFFYEDLVDAVGEKPKQKESLFFKTPQPRQRKVSVYDLIEALEQALEVKRRRVLNTIIPKLLDLPEKKRDITLIILELYAKIKELYSRKKGDLLFSELLPSNKKEDKVLTFVPLLHLTNERKVDLEQKEAFGEIFVKVLH